jgi:hypothetical protein
MSRYRGSNVDRFWMSGRFLLVVADSEQHCVFPARLKHLEYLSVRRVAGSQLVRCLSTARAEVMKS